MSYRKISLEEFPHYCVCCGFGLQKEGGTEPKPLEIHHFDNAEKKNNQLSNLVILCNRCHRLQGLGFIKNQEIKEKKRQMIKKSQNGATFQKYRKKLAIADQRRWSEIKNWEGNWKGIHKDARKKATATLKKQKRKEKAKNPNRVEGGKKAWRLMRSARWKKNRKSD